jgi:hypothetical protein
MIGNYELWTTINLVKPTKEEQLEGRETTKMHAVEKEEKLSHNLILLEKIDGW